MTGESYYELLGLTNNASEEEIRRAYFLFARKYHPDSNQNPLAIEIFYQIQQAYDVLIDPVKRRSYDSKTPEETSTLPVSVKILYSRSELPRLAEPQLHYILLELACSESLQSEKESQVHICIVIDKSTSMKGGRIEMVKENIRKLLRTLRPNDIISIVAFNDKAEVIVAPTSVSDRFHIEDKVDKLIVAGGTEIFNGLAAGIDLLWHGNSTSFVKHLVLLTDGHTYGDEEKCFSLMKKAVENKIVVNAFGLGHEWNDNFLDHLTSITGGTSQFVTSPHDLNDFMTNLSDSILTTYARGLSLEYFSETNIDVKYIFRIHPDISLLDLEQPVALGDLYLKKGNVYLICFEISSLADVGERLTMLKGKIRMEVNSSKIEKSRLLLNIELPIKESLKREQPPIEILNALSKITLYHLQEKALADVQNGEINGAIKKLSRIATQLLMQGNREFAKTVLNEAENLYTNQQLSNGGEKILKYGTKALLLLDEPEKREQ
jgi:Ca-activated chloride channel homolog